MIVLSRMLNESIIIGERTVVTVVDIRGEKVRLGILGPPDVTVHRQEIWEAVQRAANKNPPKKDGAFKVNSAGSDRFGLAAICQRFVNEQWLAENLTAEQATAEVLESFKRAVVGELELLGLTAKS